MNILMVLLGATARGALLLAPVLLLAGWPRLSAAARHRLLVTGLLGTLVLPAATLLAPPLTLSLPPASLRAASGLDHLSFDRTTPPPLARAVALVDRDATAKTGGASNAALLAGWLLAGFALGAGALAASLALALLQARALGRRGHEPAAESDWPAMLADLSTRLDIRRPVRLLLAPVAVPCTWGALRPVVLLPEAASGWPLAARRHALLHELAHVERHDWSAQLLARLACILHWPNPLAWAAARRLRLEAERAADDRVLASGACAADYAEQLLALAGRRQGRQLSVPALALAMARPAAVATRIRSILDPRRRREPLRALPAAGLAALVLALAGLLAAGRLSAGTAPVRPRKAISEREWHQRFDQPLRVEGLPALLCAAWEGDSQEVRRLLAAGADPDGAVASHGTPLILAASRGHSDIVELLLAAGADPALAETGGEREADIQRTPLGAAAQGGDVRSIELLLAAGAPVDFAPPGDATPLMSAAEGGHIGAVERLLQAGADADARVRGDGSPLIAAARSGETTVARLLLDAGADPNGAVRGDESPLYQAVANGDRRMVTLLLAAGADPRLRPAGAESPLALAAEEGDAGMLELLDLDPYRRR